MNSFPFFSVVIPTYNRENIIKKAIDSVLSQSFQDFEIIIIDNGSTDKTKQFIKSYSNAKIKYFYQIGSGSPASPRNAGIRNSSAPWVCFLDSDDYFSYKIDKIISLGYSPTYSLEDEIDNLLIYVNKEFRVKNIHEE